MSVGLMSTIFETEFFDLPYKKDGEDRTAKASTCKLLLLAIADHANDYGESSYPGYKRLVRKTALSKQGIADTLDALEQNGILKISERESKLHTNNYTIILSAFPRLGIQEPKFIESSHLTTGGQATLQTIVKPLDLNHQLTINQPSVVDASFPEPTPTKKQGDLVDGLLALAQSPGIKRQARIDAILSATAEKLHVRTTGKRWEEFAKLADDRQQHYGESLITFLDWLTAQKGFSPQYWPPNRMAEFWPQAFIAPEKEDRPEYRKFQFED